MCAVLDCTGADARETARWRAELRICSRHLSDLRKYLHSSASTLARDGTYDGADVVLPAPLDPIVDDYVKVIVLLQFCPELCMATLRESYQEYSLRKEGNWSVSKALAHYEGICWFPENRIMLMGYLSAEAFEAQISLGLNTDPGAGIAHGSLSHRFQWHVIMRIMTDGFQSAYLDREGWSTSPLDLFMSYSIGYGQQHNAWGKSMDLQAHRGWGNPDNVLAQIRASDLQQFKESLDHRAERAQGRLRAVNDALGQLIEEGVAPPAAFTESKLQQDIVSQAHSYKKVGGPSAIAITRVERLIQGGWGLTSTGDIAIALWLRLRSREATRTYAVSSKEPRYRQVAPLVLSGRGEPLIEVDDARIRSSREGLNTSDFTMSVMGVTPLVQ